VPARALASAVAVALLLGVDSTTGADRADVLARASVWRPIDTTRADIARGPDDVRGFGLGEIVPCRYEPKTLGGNSPKFSCATDAGDSLKVKFGGTNGEVFAEVAATRLLWALGFGADRLYPARVLCTGCPRGMPGIEADEGRLLVVPAAIERKFPAPEIRGFEGGWAWPQLDAVSEKAGGAPRAHRDALKLLAVFLQHTDSKPQQQRIVCLDREPADDWCGRPFMLLNDVGLTFGRASRTNANAVSSANLEAWSQTPVWRFSSGCVGNLPKSFTGTLENPVIGEAGRAFLAQRLEALSDEQLRTLFTVARFDLRPADPVHVGSPAATVDAWVTAFKAKRTEIATRRCS
jgi:hypothetical protein